MKSIEALGAFALSLMASFALVMFFIGDDISRNEMREQARQNAEQAKIERNAEVVSQWRAEQAMLSLGCVTLDCAIDKSMK